MLKVSASMSDEHRLRAGRCAIVPAVAKNVNGVVITSSPAPMSSARSASSSASVPFAQPMAYFVCDSAATSRSKSSTGLPRMKGCSSTTLHHRRDDLRRESRVLRAQIEQRDRHQVPMGAGSSRRAWTAAARATSCHSCSERTCGGRDSGARGSRRTRRSPRTASSCTERGARRRLPHRVVVRLRVLAERRVDRAAGPAPLTIRSTPFGRPSCTLNTRLGRRCRARAGYAPCRGVASTWKPISWKRRAIGVDRRLVGIVHGDEDRAARAGAPLSAASCALANALPNDVGDAHHLAGRAHLGPEHGSTPRNLLNGNTASFTETYGGTISVGEADRPRASRPS